MDETKLRELEARVEALGNVSRACIEAGIPRSLYYKWKQVRSAEAGNGGNAVKRHPRRRHPHAASEALVAEVLRLAQAHPDWGCGRIALYLELRKQPLSATTVRKLLRKARVK